MFKIALFCGGPSLERGISLNSARSVLDHLARPGLEIQPIYINQQKKAYAISTAQLYSNTPSDFDFKLAQTAVALSEKGLVAKLKKVDLVFPAIHGEYGDDGELQAFLEEHNIPFVGSMSKACEQMFHKIKAAQKLAENGFFTYPAAILRPQNLDNKKIIKRFFEDHDLKKVIIKPVLSGSSIGVFAITNPTEALEKMNYLFAKNMDMVMIEPFCEGVEFTVIVLQSHTGEPVALMPSEIEISYQNNKIFCYRSKYLPTVNVFYHCPSRFEEKLIKKIQESAEDIFRLFKMRDFVRIDGWIRKDGKIWFPDINPISGMEQNSFMFKQPARIGMTHGDLLDYVVKNACQREGLKFPEREKIELSRKTVRVLFGGKTAERQVSVMSGTNVWLKLRHSKKYASEPYFLDIEGNVWQLPYAYTLCHTAEEILAHCKDDETVLKKVNRFREIIIKKLQLSLQNDKNQKIDFARKISLKEFIAETKQNNEFVFLGLHGGDGEDGTIQKKLEDLGILYNGSDAKASKIGMDKYETGKIITALHDELLITASKMELKISNFYNYQKEDFQKYWQKLKEKLGADSFIIKPRRDGCSAGIIRLYDSEDLEKYVNLVKEKAEFIPENTFSNQPIIIEMSLSGEDDFLIESFIKTDEIVLKNNKIDYKKETGWLELTAGVLETKGKYQVFNPSITVAERSILSLEEKFQGGTGVNITPPPENMVSAQMLDHVKTKVAKAANALSIKNYARIDLFLNVDTEKVLIIEANTLPGLTPSTVIFQQALAEKPSLAPRDFLEKIIDLKYHEGY